MRRPLATTLTLALTLAFTLAFTSVAAPAVRQQETPRVTKQSKPPYGAIARAARVEGSVNVEVEIDAEGRVTSAQADAASHPLLRKTAEDAARRWTFERSSARRVRAVRLTFEFRHAVVTEGDAEEEKPASPYHVIIRRTKKKTVSYVAPDAEKMFCEVHGFRLEKDTVKIVYGLPVHIVHNDGETPRPSAYEEARKTLFPQAAPELGGGCVIDDESPEFAEVLVCAACRIARENWLREHSDPEDDD